MRLYDYWLFSGNNFVRVNFMRKLSEAIIRREPYLTCNEHHRSPVKSLDVLAAGSWPRLDIRWFSNVTCAGRRFVFACMTSLLPSSVIVTAVVLYSSSGSRCDRFVISRSRDLHWDTRLIVSYKYIEWNTIDRFNYADVIHLMRCIQLVSNNV